MALQRSVYRDLAALIVIGFLLWFPYVRGTRVPLLWAADLGFHELGHLLAVPLGQTFQFLAGSVTQVLVPAGLALYFWFRTGDRMAAAVMCGWAAASAHDASVYIADAPFQRLPLIGGHHDWNWLLSHWDALGSAAALAQAVAFAGMGVGLVGVAIVAGPWGRPLWEARRTRSASRRGPTPEGSPIVRPARFAPSSGSDRGGD